MRTEQKVIMMNRKMQSINDTRSIDNEKEEEELHHTILCDRSYFENVQK